MSCCCWSREIGSREYTPPIGVMATYIFTTPIDSHPLVQPWAQVYEFYANHRNVLMNHSTDIYDYRLIYMLVRNTDPVTVHGIDEVVTQSTIPNDWTGRVVVYPIFTESQFNIPIDEFYDAAIAATGDLFDHHYPPQTGFVNDRYFSGNRRQTAYLGNAAHPLYVNQPGYVEGYRVSGGLTVYSARYRSVGVLGPYMPAIQERFHDGISWVFVASLDGAINGYNLLGRNNHGDNNIDGLIAREGFWGALYDVPPADYSVTIPDRWGDLTAINITTQIVRPSGSSIVEETRTKEATPVSGSGAGMAFRSLDPSVPDIERTLILTLRDDGGGDWTLLFDYHRGNSQDDPEWYIEATFEQPIMGATEFQTIDDLVGVDFLAGPGFFAHDGNNNADTNIGTEDAEITFRILSYSAP